MDSKTRATNARARLKAKHFPTLSAMPPIKDLKFCLCSIVKNESQQIERMLDSARDVFAQCKIPLVVAIRDTGSTDGTPKIIRLWGKRNEIPTKVYEAGAFKNFGYDRTQSYLNACEAFSDFSHMILLDADMCLRVHENFSRKNLIRDKYSIRQKSHRGGTNLEYYNVRIISRRIRWVCMGVTHEFVDIHPDEKKSEPERFYNDDFYIDDYEDGGCKADKFIRDERLLREAIANPSTVDFLGYEDDRARRVLKQRYYFYHAQTLRNMDRWKESIPQYRSCIAVSSYDEEIYNCHYSIGKCFKELADHCDEERLKEAYQAKAEEALLTAYRYRKCRAEALYLCVFMNMMARHYERAKEQCLELVKIEFPPAEILFVEKALYADGGYYSWFLLAQLHHHTGEPKAAVDAAKRCFQFDIAGGDRERMEKIIAYNEF